MKKKKSLPGAFAALTKDTRFAGTFEVLVPVPDRVKPHRVPQQFKTKESAEAWIHSSDGKDVIAEILGAPVKAAKAVSKSVSFIGKPWSAVTMRTCAPSKQNNVPPSTFASQTRPLRSSSRARIVPAMRSGE